MAEDQLDSSASLLAQYGQSDEDHIVVHSGIEVGRVRIRDVKEGRGWGLFKWYPGELGWWIPQEQRTHDVPPGRR